MRFWAAKLRQTIDKAKKQHRNYIFLGKSLSVSQKVPTFAPANKAKRSVELVLGYGVMVTLQILVLPFLVRVRVAQHQNIPPCNPARRDVLFVPVELQ